MRTLTALSLMLCMSILAIAQTAQDYAVQIKAIVSANPAQIELRWPAHAGATGYTVYRKTKTSQSWGSAIATLPGTDTSYTDTNVSPGDGWEYRLVRSNSTWTAYGYIYAGIEAPAIEDRGTVLLVVDSTYNQPLAAELQRLEEDLTGDGWTVSRLDVGRNDAVASVKTSIQSVYTSTPDLNAIFLIGHIPVPYSGNLNPDGHPDHQGAWPADVFYGELTSTWGDVFVNNSSASRPQNRNIPGDGKYDQSQLPSDVEVPVGRVDFYDMPSFSLSDTALLKRYFDKNHDFRHKVFTAVEKAVIDDNFGGFSGEAFAASGWKNFGPLVGPENTAAGNYFTVLGGAETYLWSYGCGGGTYTSASGVGNTGNFAANNVHSVFTMLFGSYHGDWDSQNNFMRASLASAGEILTCAWSGRPHWAFHHMGLGETIGYSTKLSQNNSSTYFGNLAMRWIHIALMGDPTLKMHIVAPPAQLTATPVNNDRWNDLSWNASADSVLGYWIYRAASPEGPFSRITGYIHPDTSWRDSCPMIGNNYYMVRAVALTEGYSGTYYNLSQGIFDDAANSHVFAVADPAGLVFCAGDTVQIPFTLTGPACQGGNLVAELSDSVGSFASPAVIATTSDTTSGMLTAVIPANASPGNQYFIRLITTSPGDTTSANPSAITINPLPQAMFNFTAFGDSVAFSNTSMYGSSWLWDFGDGDTDTSANPGHDYNGSGNYTVTLIAGNSCGTDTFMMAIGVVGMDEAISEGELQIWPNPAKGQITVADPSGMEIGVVEIYNLNGQLMLREQVKGKEATIALDMLKAGFYMVKAGGKVKQLVISR